MAGKEDHYLFCRRVLDDSIQHDGIMLHKAETSKITYYFGNQSDVLNLLYRRQRNRFIKVGSYTLPPHLGSDFIHYLT